MLFHDWLVSRPRYTRRRPARPRRQPCLELLEDRSLPSVFTVIDMGDAGIGFDDHGDLRYCINQANANGEPSNLIKFHRGLEGTIVLTQGPLDIAKDLTIRGPADGGVTISGNHRSGVFDITDDPRVQAVTLSDLTIADGTGVTANGRRAGGGLYNDHATVTLDHVVVIGNAVSTGGAGGGIYNAAGTLILNASTVSGNSVASSVSSNGIGGGIVNATGAVILNSSTVFGNSVANNGFGGGIEDMSGTLTLNSSTVSGNSVGSGQFGSGGGVASGRGLVVVNSSSITDNTAGTNVEGGGLDLEGPATITDSTIAGNTAGTFGGGINLREDFLADSRISVTRSVIRGNSAGSGGGLFNSDGAVTIDHTTVSGNFARSGSGVENYSLISRMTITDSLISDNTGGSGISGGGHLALSDSTIAGNSTPGEGGGLAASNATVVNCTISGNTAGTAGGGIFFSGGGILELTSVTITGNEALGVESFYIGGGGLWATANVPVGGHLFVRNTLIAGNATKSLGADVFGYVESLDYNLVGQVEDSRGWTSTDTLGHTYAPLNPLLGPLQDNGGPTPTHALLAGSPAIDTGDPLLLGTYDQRGTVRIHNGLNPPVDIGAFDSGVRYRFQIQAPAEVVAGEPFAVTVVPVDAFGFKVSTFTGTIHFSSSDGAAVLPADYTFAPEDAGVASFRITLQTEGSQQLVVNDADIPSIRASATVTVDPAAAPGTPRARFADLAFAGADPTDGWLPVPGRKHARTN